MSLSSRWATASPHLCRRPSNTSRERDLQDGRGVWRGDQLPPHKYIRNISTCGTTPTEHLLNAGRRPQTSQKFFILSSFFSAFSSELCGWQGLMFWPGVRPVPLRWESQVQDTDPPETSRLHVISNGESSPRDLHLNAKTQLQSMTSKLQCWTPYAKQLARQEHNLTH